MELILIIREAEKFVRTLMATSLPDKMYFHNISHTQNVVHGVTEIGFYTDISFDQMAVLQTAAWFHDVGYCFIYNGHEDSSIAIAATYLQQQNCSAEFIEQVSNCIKATKMPQLPNNILEEILCDADMYHLAAFNYEDFAERLKMEWKSKLGKDFSEGEWCELNLKVLEDHQYKTKFGRLVLQHLKLQNIEKLLKHKKG